MSKFEVVSEYRPSGESPQKLRFCGNPLIWLERAGEARSFQGFGRAKTLVRR